jgi:hypothetical protein
MSIVSQLDLFGQEVLASAYGPFISRTQAKRQNLRHYYSGKPCKRGHFSPRFIECCKCVECSRVQSLQGMLRWYQDNSEEARERARRRRIENGDAIRAAQRARNKTPSNREKERLRSRRRREALEFRLLAALRNRLCDAIRGKNKSAKTQELLGCTVDELINHLQGQFQPGMNWDNWRHDGWHIDHIIPCSSFDLTDPQQQRKCFHYSNLQPLWAFDNLSKGAKVS